ncbi:ABC transporter substrate-binding protein [Kaistia terrae]|jgi:NitT/TauT family transport system substrate-binding protein|uniref:ABC transporter substrate-binding protein n=1 Tax=Kaistia terrae TaxID=537017 RepID=A0ABW0PNG6_9HYPH|nr:ABC transporter substrate-binding protein [Kaistia terrae]MCX5580030.1 ABC transporter substrate-binding protein [Kaistia terrae]
MTSIRTKFIGLTAGAAALAFSGQAFALDEISFGTNWLAQAEHGGFYQAVVDGTYEKHGLKVTIVQGGPQAANRQLMLAGKTTFNMAGNMVETFSAAAEEIPLVEVAAIFQKDPQVIIAHPDVDTFADLAKLDTLLLSKDGYASYFQWMKSAFPGFRDEQFKPYTFNPAPFLADPKSAQQGYITSEPFEIAKQADFKPKLFLLADEGFSTYGTLIEGTQEFVAANPDITQRFVDASIIGWNNYLYGDNKAANDLIKKENPEITDEQIAYSIATMKEYGLVDSGDTLEKGIGCMTDARVKDFQEKMVKAGVIKADLDLSKFYTTQFVCKKVGMDLKK